MKPGRGTRLGLGIAAVAVLVTLAAFLPWPGTGGAGDVPVLRVAPQDFQRRVPAPGTLEAVKATPVAVPMGVPGPFRIGWVAQDGSRIKQGDVVIRFDPSAIEKRLIDAEDELKEARLTLEKNRIEGSAELRKLERDAALARLELEDAKQFQKKDAQLFSRADIIESEIDQGLAQEREEHARSTRQTREKLSGTEAALLQIKIRQADAKISQARAALQALTVTAPHDGVLILKRNWRGDTTRVGDSVWNGQPLAEIPDLVADAGRGLRAGGGRRRLEARPAGHGDGRIRPGSLLAGEDLARRFPGQAAHPGLARAVLRRHPGARPHRSAGDEARAAGAVDALPGGGQGRPAGAAPGPLRPRGPLRGLPPGRPR